MAKRKTTDYSPDPSNANTGTERGLRALDDSLAKYGAGRSILVDKNGYVIAGNKTLERAVDLGIENVIEVDNDGHSLVAVRRTDLDLLSDPKARELAYADNRVAELDLTWNVEQLLADLNAGVDLSAMWREDELAELLVSILPADVPTDPGAQVDKAAELQQKWQVSRGDLWTIGKHRLLCGDSTNADDVARVMAGERADCVFTSPPYAVGVDYGGYDDTIDNLRAMLPTLAKLWLDVVVDGGFAVINYGDVAPARNIAGTDEPCEYPMAIEYWPVFRDAGWLLWSRRIWCKPTPRVHSPWCIQSNRAATDFEHLWTWRKSGEPIMKRVDGEFSSVNGWIDTSHLPGVDEGKDIHGAGMATGIAQWMLTTHSRRGSAVFEPFTGTGTTLVACHQLGRQGRGIEISEAYVAVCLERMYQLTGITPTRSS